MALLRQTRSFVFPGGNAGVDPGHVAFSGGKSASLKFSGVAISGQAAFSRIDKASPPTVAGAPASAMDGLMGPCFFNSAGNSGVYFTIGAAKAPQGPGMTLAAIGASWGSQAGNTVFLSGDDQGDQALGASNVASTWTPGFWCGGSGFTLLPAAFLASQYQPMFLVVSFGANGIYNAVRSVQGGKTVTASGACTAPVEPAGVDRVGIAAFPNGGAAVQGSFSRIAAGAVLRTFLTIPLMVEWANDPWSFWYPRSMNALSIGKAAAAAAVAGCGAALLVGV